MMLSPHTGGDRPDGPDFRSRLLDVAIHALMIAGYLFVFAAGYVTGTDHAIKQIQRSVLGGK